MGNRKGKERELTMLHGSIWDKIPAFALPIAAAGILGQLFNAADIAIVGNFTGAAGTLSVAAVGANSAVVGLLLNFCIGISLGANVVIANAVGAGDNSSIRGAVHTAVMMALVGGVLIAAIGEAAAGPLMRALQVPEDVFPYALLYLRIYLLGLPVIFLYNFEAAIFRSVGETRMPLQALLLAGILNVVLNLLFVAGWKRTVDGVAIATVLSNAVSAGYLLYRLVRSDQPVRVELSAVGIDQKALAGILRIGLPAGMQSAVFALANIVVQSAVNSLGVIVMAASSAAANIESFAYYVLSSFGQACTTFVGQNYGAGQIGRCKKILLLCLAEGLAATFLTILTVLLSGRFLLSVFNPSPEVVEIGYIRLLLVFTAYLFTTLYEIMSGYLRGFGISVLSAILTIFGVCVVRIVWVVTVFPKSRTFQTLMTVYPVSLAVTAILIFGALLLCRPAQKKEDQER